MSVADAEREIVQILYRFARIVDGRDWSAMDTVFSEGVVSTYGDDQQCGREVMLALFRRHLDPCGPTQHFLGNITVEINGNEARSSAYVQARHQGKGATAALTLEMYGEYHDGWKLMPQGWRIVRRDPVWFYQTGDVSVLAS